MKITPVKTTIIILLFVLIGSYYFSTTNSSPKKNNSNYTVSKKLVSSEKNEKSVVNPTKLQSKKIFNDVTNSKELYGTVELIDPLLKIDLSKNTVIDLYDDLLERSNDGDLNARYTLGMLLYKCINSPKDKEELQARINRNYQQSSEGYGLEQSLLDNYRICEGVNDLSSDYLPLIESAAESGHLLSMNAYSVLPILDADLDEKELQQVVNDYQEKKFQFLNQSMDRGSVYATMSLGMAFYTGENTKQDKIKAYAYLRLAEEYQSFRTNKLVIERINGDMTVYDRDEAEELFTSLLKRFGKEDGVKLYSNK